MTPRGGKHEIVVRVTSHIIGRRGVVQRECLTVRRKLLRGVLALGCREVVIPDQQRTVGAQQGIRAFPELAWRGLAACLQMGYGAAVVVQLVGEFALTPPCLLTAQR